MSHEDSKSQEMQPLKRLRQAFIVACQPPEASHPTQTALDNPTARQQYKAFPGLRQLHDFQLQTVLGSSFSRHIARVALVNKSDFNRIACRRLNSLCQL